MSGYIGASGSGIVSLREHLTLVSNDEIDTIPSLPTSTGNLFFPTDSLQMISTLGGTGLTRSSTVGFWLDPAGNYLFTCSANVIWRYDFGIPNDFTTLGGTATAVSQSFDFQYFYGLHLHPDGTKLFGLQYQGSDVQIRQFNFAVPFDPTTLTYSGKSLLINPNTITLDTAPKSMSFSPDGTKIYITGSGYKWYQINLATAWDVSSTATFYAEQSDMLIASATLGGLAFSTNGDYVFFVDSVSDSDQVLKYELNTPWDLSTLKTNQLRTFRYQIGEYTGGFQELTPTGGTFNSDGTKFYYTGSSVDNVWELELGTAYDITTASFNANLKTYYTYTGGGNRTVYSMDFSSDGTKVYLLGSTNDIRQLNLTTAWDPTTIEYDTTFSFSSEETAGRDFFFKPDGTKLFIIGTTGDDINEYTLSTAWDVDTASFVTSFSVGGQDTLPVSLQFSPDGTNLYVLGDTGNDLNQYSLSTAGDISSASYVRVKPLLTTGLTLTVPSSLLFNPDGASFYLINNSPTYPSNYNGVVKFSLSSAWDISTASYDSSEFFATPTTPSNHRIRFNSDGTKFLMLSDGTTGSIEMILEMPLTTAYNINTAQINVGSLFNTETSPGGLHWGDSGNYLYVVGSNGDAVDQFEALVPYKASTIRYLQTFLVSGQETVPQSVFFSSTGHRMFVIGSTGDDINQYNLSTNWDISSASYSTVFSVAAQDTGPTGFCFSSDGTYLFIVGSTNDKIFAYILGTPWEISTAQQANSADASHPNDMDIAFYDITPTGLAINADGTKLYLIGQYIDCINQIELASAYKLIPKNSLFIGSEELTPTGVTFKDDGLKMYVIGSTGDDVNEYTLSTAWDISTATFSQNQSISAQEATPQAVRFNDDGTKMYVMGQTGDDVNEYALSTAWDISTATYTTVFSVNAQETAPNAFYFKPDGTKFWILGQTSDTVFQYSMSTAWDISTASYDSKSYAINYGNSTESTIPTGLYFKPDGTRFYYTDQQNQRIVSHALATAWDISTVNTARIRPNRIDGPYVPASFTISRDGYTAYCQLTYSTNSYIEVYQLTTAFDLGTAQYIGEFNTYQVNIGMDGTGRYLLGHKRDDSSFALYTVPNKGFVSNNQTYSAVTQDLTDGTFANTQGETVTRAFTFDSTGTKLYIVGTTKNTVYYYTLATAWDLSTVSYVDGFNLSGYSKQPCGIRIVEDGRYMLIFCAVRFSVMKFHLDTAYDITTAVLVDVSDEPLLLTQNIDYNALNNRLLYTSAYFSADGSMIYLTTNKDSAYQFPLRDYCHPRKFPGYVNFDSHNLNVQGTSTSWVDPARSKVCLSEDGKYLYAWSYATAIREIEQYELESPFKVSDKMRMVFAFVLTGTEVLVSGLRFNQDGTKMFVVGTTTNTVREYALSTPWELRSASFTTSFDISSQTTTSVGLKFNSDGTKMFVGSNTGNTLYEYDLATGWDVSTASYNSVSLSITNDLVWYFSAAADQFFDFNFNGDGTELNVLIKPTSVNTRGTIVYRYDLSSAWDLSSASYVDLVKFHNTFDSNSFFEFVFVKNGSMVYFTDSNDNVVGMQLRTAYDLKTSITPIYGFEDVPDIPETAYLVALSENGQILFLGGDGAVHDGIVGIRLDTPFDINTVSNYKNYIRTAFVPTCSFMDQSGQNFFWSRGTTIYKYDFSSINQ